MSSSLEFLCEYYRGEVFIEWLDKCYSTTFNHGYDLVIALATPCDGRAGSSDNVATAESYLKAAEKERIIQTALDFPTPNTAQVFFNVQAHAAKKGHVKALRGETEYGWVPTEKTRVRLKELKDLIDSFAR